MPILKDNLNLLDGDLCIPFAILAQLYNSDLTYKSQIIYLTFVTYCISMFVNSLSQTDLVHRFHRDYPSSKWILKCILERKFNFAWIIRKTVVARRNRFIVSLTLVLSIYLSINSLSIRYVFRKIEIFSKLGLFNWKYMDNG